MHPLLFTFGPLVVTSFGFFLTLALIIASFVIWRICRNYDLEEERIIDINLIVFIAGLIGARIYYILSNIEQFNNLDKILFFIKYPGLSFWGSLIGGSIGLFLASKVFKFPLWQIADFIAVGFFIGLFFGDIGCLLSSCEYGTFSTLPIAVNQVGLIGKRFPIQILEAILLLFSFSYLWNSALRFHFSGKILSNGLIILGLIKFFTEFLRGDSQKIIGNLSLASFNSALIIILGIVIFYLKSKRNVLNDLHAATVTLIETKKRQTAILKFKKRWYNFFVNWKILLSKYSKNIFKKINVKSTPPKL